MQRHDDASVSAGRGARARELGADQQEMMDMDHVRPEVGQQLRQVRNAP